MIVGFTNTNVEDVLSTKSSELIANENYQVQKAHGLEIKEVLRGWK